MSLNPCPDGWCSDWGSLDQLRREVERLGARRSLVLATPQQQVLAENVAARLGEYSTGIFPEAVRHLPVEVARRARDEAYWVGADCLIAAGGGSTIGLGKAIALHSSLPILAVPTTYAGPEMTPIYGLTEAGISKRAMTGGVPEDSNLRSAADA